MKDFNLVEYLREHKQGSFGMLNHYVDLKPLKEEDNEVPYPGPEHKLDGLGDEFDQEEAIPEIETDDLENTTSNDAAYDMAYDEMDSEQGKYDRMMGLADIDFEKVSPIVKSTIDSLRADGFDDQDILDFLATDFSLAEEPSSLYELYKLYNNMKEDNEGFKSEHPNAGDWERFYQEGYNAGYKKGYSDAKSSM